MNGIPWDLILFSPLGFSMFLTAWIQFLFLLIILMKTPALTFFLASLRKRMILINPRGDRRIEFKRAKRYGNLAHVKNQGYYLIDPNDVYNAGGSPAMIAFGRFAIPINLKMAKIAERLRDLGIKNWEYMMKWIQNIQDKEAKNQEKNPGSNPKKEVVVNLLGESVPIHVAVDYFNRNERADFIESEIHRRTANEIMKQTNSGRDMMKWIIGVGILIMMVFVGYAIFQTAIAGSGGSVSLPAGVEELLKTPRVISEGTALD